MKSEQLNQGSILCLLVTALLYLASCESTSQPSDPIARPLDSESAEQALEFLPHQKIVKLHELDDGSVWISFEYSARYFRISPEVTPSGGSLIEIARLYQDSEEAIHATARIRKQTEDQGPPDLIRIALTPDPRAAE